MERRITVGMSFNCLAYARSEQNKHAKVNGHVLVDRDGALCEYKKDCTDKDPISVSWCIDRDGDNKVDYVTYQRYDINGFFYRGVDTDSANFNEIWDYENKQYAKDLDNDGIVDEDEIFDIET